MSSSRVAVLPGRRYLTHQPAQSIGADEPRGPLILSGVSARVDTEGHCLRVHDPCRRIGLTSTAVRRYSRFQYPFDDPPLLILLELPVRGLPGRDESGPAATCNLSRHTRSR